MLCSAVERYIAKAGGLPFFYAVGDLAYGEILSELKQRGVAVDRVSDFCPREDKLPSLDDMIDYFRTLDGDGSENRHVLVGLGEYLALRGAAAAEKELRRLKNTTLGAARVILLLRGVTPQLLDMVREDGRLSAQQRVEVSEQALSSLSVICLRHSLPTGAAVGVKGLLRALEDGAAGNCAVYTALSFPQSLLPVAVVDTAYGAVKKVAADFAAEERLGMAEQWEWLLEQLKRRGDSMAALFERYGFSDDYEASLYRGCAGRENRNWLYFLYLRHRLPEIKNRYLQHVVSVTDCFEDLKDNILTEIIRVPRTDARFAVFYRERKKLLKGFPQAELAIFIHENSVDPQESIYRLTDSTILERQEIVKWVAQYGYRREVGEIYPDLARYLEDYVFDCGKLSDELTEYFRQYRMQKVENRVWPAFEEEKVLANARRLPYARLESRDSAILRVPDKQTAYLYWIDALGVEYLPYLTALAREKGLSIHVDVTHGDLPSITSFNRGFYDRWSGPLKYKEEDLDNIKHKEKGGFNFTKCQAPIHLPSELDVIRLAVDRAATELAMHRCRSFIITGDHGSSRLAVLRRKTEKYPTDTKGEHSGRCCREFPDADLPFAIRENGFLVLADYGRFSGSRAANVEVHGGASLEETVVPVVTLTLKRQTGVTVRVLRPEEIYAHRHQGTAVELYLSDVEHREDIAVVIDGRRYPAVSRDAAHYTVALPDIRRARKNVCASVYDGGDLVGTVTFDVKSRTAEIDPSFDALF